MRDHPFFKDTPRRSLDMAGQSLEFPVFYYDVRFIIAAFTAKTTALRKLLPHPKFKPIQIWPGVGMLGIAAFEYRDTSVGPYNEIAITIPIKFPPGFIMPGLSAIKMIRKNLFPVYIHHLPVTTEIAHKFGIHFYNYPKSLAEITFQDRDDSLEVTLKEKGDLILKLLSKKLPLKRSAGFEFHTYSVKNNVVLHAQVEGWAPKFGSVMMGNIAELELGEHRVSREIAELNLGRTARTGLYAEGAMTKLHDPDQRWCGDTLELLSR
ncbi:MAG TPA: acetoacetate decarboxylase family protein [Desulfatiglandales bacterium]|nr:acetoacetate decarboxylase family protein [Desulfatiglandales bacterium]